MPEKVMWESYHRQEMLVTSDGIFPSDDSSFRNNTFESSNFKIYIIKRNGNYLYIGKTKQSIAKKFKQGFRSYRLAEMGKKEAGYGGYKWIKDHINTGNVLRLYVFELGNSFSDNHTESIEAEIVFQIRNRTGMWPINQNEIHFFNEYNDSQEFAQKILAHTND